MLTELRLYTVGANIVRPRRNLKKLFFFSRFSVTKSTKSQQGGLAPSSLRTSVRRARVSRASRAWQVRAANGRAKVGDFAALRNLILPRVRTKCTKKPSRFVHALSARPHNRVGGRGFGLLVDGIGAISAILSIGYTWVISCRGRRSPVSATPTHTLRVCVNSPTTRTILQARNAPTPTRIRCCAMLGYGEPRGRCLGAIIGKPVR